MASELSEGHIRSGAVMTVLGPVPVADLGVTLMHEHTLLDTSSWWKRPCCASDIGFAERPIEISMIGDLRMNPFLNRDNCGLLDVKVAIEELAHFVEYGGRTVVDPTNVGKVYPGCITEIMAVPWQADFRDCDGGAWWPSQRPDIAMTDGNNIPGSQATWEDPIPEGDHQGMVDHVLQLGFIVAEQAGGQRVFVEADRDPQFPRNA